MRAAARDGLDRLVSRPIAHRGFHGCGTVGRPVENSIGAAVAAAAAGWGVECDVRLSRDGEVMVFHDATLARLTGADGSLAAFDAAALGDLRLGRSDEGIPTLRALLDAIAGLVPVVVEIKAGCAPELVERTLAIVADQPLVSIESFDPVVVTRALDGGALCPIGLVGPPEDGGTPDPDAVARCAFLSWRVDALAQAATLTNGRALTSWTVRTSEQRAEAGRRGAQIVFEGFDPRLPPSV